MYNRTRQCLAYADDIVVLEKPWGVFDEFFMLIEVAVWGLRLKIVNKTIRINASNRRSNHTLINGWNYEEAGHFKYLGSLTTPHDNIEVR